MKLFLLPAFVFATVSAQGENPCSELSTCMREAAEKFEECQSLLDEVPPRKERPGTQCRQELKAILEEKKAKHGRKSQMFESCLERRLGELEEEPIINEVKCERKKGRLQEKLERRASRKAGKFGNRRRAGRMNDFKQCMQEAKEMTNGCKQLVACCSEAPICHLEYEVSDLHDEIKSLQLDIILTRRECRKEQGQDRVSDNDIVTASQVLDADLGEN